MGSLPSSITIRGHRILEYILPQLEVGIKQNGILLYLYIVFQKNGPKLQSSN
jgi:hypothetical protein